MSRQDTRRAVSFLVPAFFTGCGQLCGWARVIDPYEIDRLGLVISRVVPLIRSADGIAEY